MVGTHLLALKKPKATMRSFLMVLTVFSFIIAVITMVASSTMFGQICALIIMMIGVLGLVGGAVLDAIQREGTEIRRALSRSASPE